jgi:AcrR family transcriptional regulator
MGDVASAAHVSKALVHYHFHDKDSLLVALAEKAGDAVLGRARNAVDGSATTDEHVLDAYWSTLDTELRAGDLRVLLALAACDSERVRAVCRRFATQRRELTSRQITSVFERLGLQLRVPAELVADTVVAFTDGLAHGSALEPERPARPAFDVLWLALLTLTE